MKPFIFIALALLGCQLLASVEKQSAWIQFRNLTNVQKKELSQELRIPVTHEVFNGAGNSVQALYHRPDVFAPFLRIDDVVERNSKLSLREQILIALTVAAKNKCQYCLSSAKQVFQKKVGDFELLQKFLDSPETAGTPRENAILKYATTLTQSPDRVERSYVDKLKSVGLSDREIFDLAFLVSWMNLKTRMAIGLGYGPDAKHVF